MSLLYALTVEILLFYYYYHFASDENNLLGRDKY